jgi:methylated-DNA-[protein]-cysteine S-methyltransferase
VKQVVIRDTPIGPLTVAARSGRICAVHFGEKLAFQAGESPDLESEPVLGKAVLELEAYFSGDLREFTVPVALDGPPFHVRVWKHLTRIPFGQVETYGQIAQILGSPGGARAVGNACAANPVPVIVPCHRVLASAGLGGYGGGLPAKEWLLRHEGVL